jgi:RHH-type transcriptional regulator, proline utilization regulon repressor / proline dehydrogenase / delta 1-pyrroline-5-carboxylate dehydrogenase
MLNTGHPANSHPENSNADRIRRRLADLAYTGESPWVATLAAGLKWDDAFADAVTQRAASVVTAIRTGHTPGLMESLLSEYGLNTDEGVALMCLAEAFLRTPDAATLDALITDKIGDGDWSRHLGHARSSLVNASTWALMLTGRVYGQTAAQGSDLGAAMRSIIQRLGEPVVRTAVAQAMKMLGQQFVLGSTIDDALENAKADRRRGPVLHSFDMLGEAARTGNDAKRYFQSYAKAISAIAGHAFSDDPHNNPGISVKLSALHPRYEILQRDRVMTELVPRIIALAKMAKDANIGLALDAEEADRLEISLDVFEALLSEPQLAGWHGLGIVVQAYAKRTPVLIDWLHAAAQEHGRNISVRLVKGAYWDSEVKLAQTAGLPSYPVYTRKEHTDIAYLACAHKLLSMTDRIYPQFATHNAHTAVAIEEMARRLAPKDVRFEFQRLHGMGGPLHQVLQDHDKRLRRIYAPVGIHRDLLAYLVRRLLENGANSSFVHQIVDASVPPEEIAADPVAKARAHGFSAHPAIPLPSAIYKTRANARGWNMADNAMRAGLMALAEPFLKAKIEDATVKEASAAAVTNPANRHDVVGLRCDSGTAEATAAVGRASEALSLWAAISPAGRGAILRKAAGLFEEATGEFVALAIREAGKSWSDAVAELREAVDFLHYYGGEAAALPATAQPRGVIIAISPWNFPLAIFTGQIAGALAAGNCVIAKPAEQTPLIARKAHALLLEAGVPAAALQVLEGDGATVGAALVADPRIAGVVFTGSNETARLIDVAMADSGNPDAILVAETGGLNAMIVDSTALLEQATRDIVASAFQSAGQRCSALRVLCVQEDVAADLIGMIKGAMDELRIGDPANPANDIGPVIDAGARHLILSYCAEMEREGRVIHRLNLPSATSEGTFVAPHLIRLDKIHDLKQEIFGPVLHIVTFKARDILKLADDINATGYGLTFGLHTRIDGRVDQMRARIRAGNIYINRNQIGAVVGVQPFGGEGLSGTGPKAGGPLYVRRLAQLPTGAALAPGTTQLEGPTGESNSYTIAARHSVLCLGPDTASQLARLNGLGIKALVLDPGAPDFAALAAAAAAAAASGATLALYDGQDRRSVRRALARLEGARITLDSGNAHIERLYAEKSVSQDTTASGGNATLLAAVA